MLLSLPAIGVYHCRNPQLRYGSAMSITTIDYGKLAGVDIPPPSHLRPLLDQS